MDGERIVVISENEPSFYIEDGSSVPPLVNLIITNIAKIRISRQSQSFDPTISHAFVGSKTRLDSRFRAFFP